MALLVRLVVFAVVVCTTLVSAAPNPSRINARSPLARRKWSNCTALQESTIKAPLPNPWNPLSKAEVVGLLTWLNDPAQGLNLTDIDSAGPWDNYISVTELLYPNKTDVLAYLEGNRPPPERYARFVVSVGASEEPYLQEYFAGPLPVSSRTTLAPLNFIYNRANSKTPNYSADYELGNEMFLKIGEAISDITLDILGTDLNTSTVWGIDPLWKEGDRIITWVQYWAPATGGYDSGTLLPQGLYFKFDITGRNPDNWGLLHILYDNILYNGIEDFREAWEAPGFNKLAKVVDGDWTSTGKAGENIPADHQSPPISVQPDGQRFKVDKEEKYVEWMDFSFYIGFTRDLGAGLYDINYKGKRIIYELGLQEAIAHYAGNDPTQSGTAYLDSYYGFGPYVFELVPGYDCPAYASFLDTEIHENSYTLTNKNSICLFEQDAGYPLQRHTSAPYISVTKNTVFTLRWISTIGNYDYNLDVNFYLDGSIEVKVRASGYIQGAFYANNEDYGYKIHDALSGSMHDHVLNFKADIDVLGVKNTFEKVSLVSDTVDYVWSTTPRNTMRIERSYVTNEDDGKINWPTNGAGMYVVVNMDEPNVYGEYPGYRILPGTGTPIHLTVQQSSNLINSAEFGTHHLYITKHKDSEPRSAAAANAMNPSDPLVNFGKFFNSESLQQEDIVLWFNLGMHHVPHTGDLPNTLFTTAQSSVFLSPHNYLPSDPSRFTSQQVEINVESGAVSIEEIGSTPACTVADLTPLYPDLSSYQGPQQVRKFPYLSV